MISSASTSDGFVTYGRHSQAIRTFATACHLAQCHTNNLPTLYLPHKQPTYVIYIFHLYKLPMLCLPHKQPTYALYSPHTTYLHSTFHTYQLEIQPTLYIPHIPTIDTTYLCCAIFGLPNRFVVWLMVVGMFG